MSFHRQAATKPNIVSRQRLDIGRRTDRWHVLCVIALALLASGCASGGYKVELLGNSADTRLAEMVDGEAISFQELLDLEGCSEIGVVGPYTDEATQQTVIGDADVDMSAVESFVVVSAFDGTEVVRAVRLARTPVDLTSLASQRLPCESVITPTG